jgi:NADPH:quinone reductase-like Zn-dependent oxidoreductase
MQIWRVQRFGLEGLAREEAEQPRPGEGQVLIRVRAVSLNYRDLMVVRGVYNPKMKLPRIPCSDGAGVIQAVGPGVTRFAVGDRVCGIFMQRWIDGPLTAEKSKDALGGDVDGMLAEYVALHQDGVVAVPKHLSFEEAATLPCAAVTAWNALHYAGEPVSPMRPKGTVLIQGTGGVSIFALQFARLMGARVIATSSRDEKLARTREMGADGGINYKDQPDWAKRVLEMTGGEGVDRVIEVGGAGTFGQSLRATKPGGLVAQIGVLSGVESQAVNLVPVLHKQLRVQGIYVGSRAMFEEMNRSIEEAQLRPVIDRVFAWDEVLDAFGHMQSGSHFGKIVIGTAS